LMQFLQIDTFPIQSKNIIHIVTDTFPIQSRYSVDTNPDYSFNEL
jgi:hypothetical protein